MGKKKLSLFFALFCLCLLTVTVFVVANNSEPIVTDTPHFDPNRKSDVYEQYHSTLISGFENPDEWSGTSSMDYEDFTQGNSSFVLANGEYIDKAVSYDWSSNTTTLAIWVKISDTLNLQYLHFYFQYAGSWNNYYCITYTGQTPWLNATVGKWTRISLESPSVSQIQGNPNWNNITLIRIKCVNSTNNAVTVHLDDFRIVPRKTGGYLTLRFDDGYAGEWDAFKLMDARNLRGVILPIPSGPKAVGGEDYLSLTQLHKIQSHGWDITCHSYTHPEPATGYPNFMASMTLQQQETELQSCQQWFIANNFTQGARFFVPPGQVIDSNLVSLIPKYFIASQTLVDIPLFYYQSAPTINPYAIHCVSTSNYESSSEVAILESYVDCTVAQNGWLTIFAHGVSDSALFNEFLDYVENSGVQVVTFSDIFDMTIWYHG